MLEAYQQWIASGQPEYSPPSDADPFDDPPEEFFIGSAFIYLQSLSYQIEGDETISIFNYQGNTKAASSC